MAPEAGTSNAGASTSTKKPSSRDYEVFLNFRGPDSRDTVINCLNDALVNAGFRVFYDDESIRGGEVIEGSLMEAITYSKIYIPIFSVNYASSKWCLLELDMIIKCWQKQKEEKTIFPIFHGVRVEDLKLKTNLYKAALRKHCKDMVKKWKIALRKAAGIKGWHISDHGLVKLMEIIVKRVDNELWPQSDPEKALNYVGIGSPMNKLMRLIDQDASDVRFVAIHGMVGVGKTALARVFFDKMSSHFPGGAAFVAVSGVREKFGTASVLNLQKNLISQILKVNTSSLTDTNQGVNWIKERLKNKKVLLVLDDLDNRDQLSKLADKSSWFGMGSRIIITTRNIGIMPKCEGYYQFKMQEMKPRDAKKYFSRKAFGSDSPPEEYNEISRQLAVETAGRNPLAIGAIAASFICYSKDEWNGILEELKKVAPKDFREKFMIIYRQLDYSVREIFLDIACLFIDKEIEDASYYWDAQERQPKTGIMVLRNWSFIEIVDGNKLGMQGLLRDLGRKIVDEETDISKRRSRVWSPEVALEVVTQKKGTKNVVALNLGKLNQQCSFYYKQFKGFKNLKFLKLNGGKFDVEDFKKVFSELRWLSWDDCPPNFGATNFCLERLLVLTLSETQITDDWGGWGEMMVAKDLKVLKCIGCSFLTKLPEFFAFTRLERLVFKNCNYLREIDQSIGQLKRLTYLEITNVFCMEMLPVSIGLLESLSVLKLELENLKELPASIGRLVNLKQLYLWCPLVEMLPRSVGKLKSLVELDISYTSITKLPGSVTNLKSLKVFKCEDCPLEELPDNIKRLIPPVGQKKNKKRLIPPADQKNGKKKRLI